MTFDENGVVTDYSGNPLLLDYNVSKDPVIQTRVEELAQPLAEMECEVIGSTVVYLDGGGEDCRFGECNFGDLVTDVMLWTTKNESCQIAILNGGAIRYGVPAGNITLGQILDVFPFGNSISTFELKGSQVVEALENGGQLGR